MVDGNNIQTDSNYANLAVKVFADFCCESCSCKTEKSHIKGLEDSGLSKFDGE